jgi:hypothetical protein
MDVSERFEQLIAFLGSQLPAPVEQQPADDGAIIFIGGQPPEVVVQLDQSNVIVFEYAGAWEADGFVVKPRRVGLVKWRRLSETAVMNAVSTVVKGAREMRLARYRSCGRCGEKCAPEVLSTDDVCDVCADEQRDVVH